MRYGRHPYFIGAMGPNMRSQLAQLPGPGLQAAPAPEERREREPQPSAAPLGSYQSAPAQEQRQERAPAPAPFLYQAPRPQTPTFRHLQTRQPSFAELMAAPAAPPRQNVNQEPPKFHRVEAHLDRMVEGYGMLEWTNRSSRTVALQYVQAEYARVVRVELEGEALYTGDTARVTFSPLVQVHPGQTVTIAARRSSSAGSPGAELGVFAAAGFETGATGAEWSEPPEKTGVPAIVPVLVVGGILGLAAWAMHAEAKRRAERQRFMTPMERSVDDALYTVSNAIAYRL